VTSLTAAQVVRRSAIEAIHVALGARWVDEHVRWAVGYGAVDPAAEMSAVARAAGLAEIGPLDEWLLRGPGALAAAARLTTDGTTPAIGRVVAADLLGQPVAVWLLGPDEVLLLAPVGGSALAAFATELASDDVSVIEMTGARTTLRLAGPAAPAILAELCPVDTTPTTMARADLLQAPLAGVRAFIARQDVGAQPGYTIMIARDEAAYAWDAIRHVGGPHGLTAVGPAAVAPEGSR
jgi:heterotetrameric sarcosine oxidase gamma subunit